MGKMRLAFIDSDLLHRGALKAGLTVLGFSNGITTNVKILNHKVEKCYW
jgi:hypothetical protein